MKSRCVTSILFLVSIAFGELAFGHGGPAPQTKRGIYVVKHGSAKSFADVLGKHFKDDPRVRILPELDKNCLLISAAPATYDEIAQLLKTLDRPAKQMLIDFLIAEVPAKHETKGKRKEFNGSELSGTWEDVVAKAEDLKKKGTIHTLQRFQVSTLEHQLGFVGATKATPYLTNVTMSALGGVIRTHGYQSIGTMVFATPRIMSDGKVMLEVDVNVKRMQPSSKGVQLGVDEKGQPILASEFPDSSLKSTLTVVPGQTVIADQVKQESKAGHTRTWIIVTARFAEPKAKTDKAKK